MASKLYRAAEATFSWFTVSHPRIFGRPQVPSRLHKQRNTTDMSPSTQQQLCSVKCVPCEGGVPKLTAEESQQQNAELSGWSVLSGPDRITKSWTVRNFVAAMEFFKQVTALAEDEGHHPDLHLVGYRNVTIDIWTHAIDGLSLNDFILAAKIDQLPIELKTS